jgi:FkbM family methyltransferase
LIVRRGASDIQAFKLIFLDREYACLNDLTDVRFVLDCGANVGYSAAYFLSIFPACSLIAIEPDPENFAMLERNLSGFGDRATCIRAGVWSHSAPLCLSQEKYREGTQWSRQVRVCEADEEAEFAGLDISTLLTNSKYNRISLLKMDVEGAEAVIFSDNYEPWLDKVDAIAIELHDDSMFGKGSPVFYDAIKERGFRITTSGELTICR